MVPCDTDRAMSMASSWIENPTENVRLLLKKTVLSAVSDVGIATTI